MAPVNFQSIVETLKDEVVKLALESFNSFKNEAKTDALKLLDDLKGNLETWTIELANNDLSANDFKFLVQAQKELVEMNALKQAGMALIKTDEFKNSLLNLITKTIISLV